MWWLQFVCFYKQTRDMERRLTNQEQFSCSVFLSLLVNNINDHVLLFYIQIRKTWCKNDKDKLKDVSFIFLFKP